MIVSISSTVSFEVVVDDHVIGQRQPDRLLVERLAQPFVDLVLGVATAAEAALLLVARRREHEDQHGVADAAA